MDGKVFAKLIETALAEKGIKKGDFYEAVGISATAMYGWKNGAIPKPETVEAVEKYLDLELFPFSEIKCELLGIKSDIKKQKPHET